MCWAFSRKSVRRSKKEDLKALSKAGHNTCKKQGFTTRSTAIEGKLKLKDELKYMAAEGGAQGRPHGSPLQRHPHIFAARPDLPSHLRKLSLAAALAVGACLPTVARAQPTSGVTAYGIVDLFIETGNAGKGSLTRVESGGIAQTRLGFTGHEDLGDGLGVEFTLESGFAADTGTTGANFWSRQAHVGLIDKHFGALRLGHQYTPLFLTTYAFDAFGLGTAGNFWNLSQYGNFWQDNAVVYESPTWSGVSVRAMFAPSENNASKIGRYSAISVSYSAGPLQLVGSYDQRGVVADGPQASYAAVGGTYDFNAAKLFFGLQTVKHAEPAEAVNRDARIYSAGVHVPVSQAGKVAASYIARDDRSAANQDATQIAVGYYHSLSKRTTLYTAASRIGNKNGGTLGIGYTPLPVAPGHSAQVLQVGINHTF